MNKWDLLLLPIYLLWLALVYTNLSLVTITILMTSIIVIYWILRGRYEKV